MKNLLFCSLLAFCPTVFSQVQQLKLNSDLAREKMIIKSDALVGPVTSYVNPFIGTGGHGHTFPGAILPFGMIQVSPDTRYEGWDGCSGYHYSDSVIYGFSHTHLSGTGVSDYSDVLLVPQQGKLNTIPGYKQKGGFGSSFKHANEKASPGYYSVQLDNGIEVELTATKRCALHRYQFKKGTGKRFLIVDLGYRDKVLAVSATKKSATQIQGKRVSEAWATNQHLYFHLETSIPFVKSKWIHDEKKGTYLYVLEFSKEVDEVLVKVGISGGDENGAQNNVKGEMTSFDFRKVRAEAEAIWQKELRSFEVKSQDTRSLTIFYTALYHAYTHPSLWSDLDGRYRDFNAQIAQTSSDLYSVFSLWDTYRTAHPLYTLTQPKRTVDFIESFYKQFENTGHLPVWPLSNNETNCMIGYHAVSVIADAYLKGLPVKNPNKLLDAMIATSNAQRFSIKNYASNGFVSAHEEAESVSKTLEYAYDDWCIARMAEKLGKKEIAAEYDKRSASWLNIFHPESHFFQPRNKGTFIPFFKSNEVNHHFTEANGWQYSCAVPHHVQSLIDVHGGNKAFAAFLDSCFFGSSEMTGRHQVDITGLIGQYAQGNEPSHHMAYLYNYCGQPWKTQYLLDSIMKTFYSNKPDGLCGNEDAGQMSAWYIFSSMGFYPVAPGSLTYALGRPLFEEVSMFVDGRKFTVRTQNNSPNMKYIQSITWNGKIYQKMYITHDMLRSGGILEIVMGEKPNKELSTYELDLRQVIPSDFVPVPYFKNKQTVFEDRLEVELDALFSEKGKIMVSFDGTHFQPYFRTGGSQIVLNETSTVHAKVVRDDGTESKVVTADFVKYVKDKTIYLETKYANQYSGSGSQTLVDGQRGFEEYRSLEWQGFQEEDIKGMIELKEERQIHSVEASYLKDLRSWIFPPKGLIVEVSTDGVNFKKVAYVKGETIHPDDPTGKALITSHFSPVSAKYIRFTVENFGLCPSWHLGAGGTTWLFLDEIDVK